jgi:hypothetical protein
MAKLSTHYSFKKSIELCSKHAWQQDRCNNGLGSVRDATNLFVSGRACTTTCIPSFFSSLKLKNIFSSL